MWQLIVLEVPTYGVAESGCKECVHKKSFVGMKLLGALKVIVGCKQL